MGFFDKLKLLNKKSGYVVKYKTSTLMTINPNTLKEIVLDNLSTKIIKEISSHITPAISTRNTNTLAIKLLASYNRMRKDFYNNPRLKAIGVKSREFKYFVQASEILKTHKVSTKSFMSAQIRGLAFVNNGAGVFPKPSQLVTLEAEERLVRVMQESKSKTDVEEINRIELTRADKETELMENPKFKSRYDKIEAGTVTLQDAYFISDCMLVRKGRVTKKIDNLIEELENGD